VTNDKATLHIEYNKVMMEWDEAEQKEERIQQAIQKVYSNIFQRSNGSRCSIRRESVEY
jgi:hypothetical protein